MNIFISIDSGGKITGWGSSPLSESDIAVDVEEGSEFFSSPFSFRYVDNQLIKDTLIELDIARKVKFEELSRSCKEEIVGYFNAVVDGVTYRFSNDMEAQSNFKDAKLSFADGTVDLYLGGTLPWTAYDVNGNVVRLQLTSQQFQGIYVTRLLHQNGAISKLRDTLEKQIDAVEEVSQLELIQW